MQPDHKFKVGFGFPTAARRRQLLAVGLAVGLYFFRLHSLRAEENQAGYRYQVYREDNDRIEVKTHSALFDLSLGPKVRLNGEYVIDSISGATPSGAPAYKDWDTSPVQFSREYAEANFGYLRPFFTDAEGWTNYVSTADGPSNQVYQATSAYGNSFTNSPNYRSVRIPKTEMHDFRQSISLSAPITFGQNILTPQFSRSEESDYHSVGAAVNYSRTFNDKNTTLNVGWSHNWDQVRDDNFNWQAKNTDEFFIGVNQLLSSKAYLTANVTYGNTHGYLSDPYRGIYAANALLLQDTGFSDPNGVPVTGVDGWRLENRPRKKEKIVGYLSYSQFITPLQASVVAAYRFYHDTYGVNAHTMDVAWHQKIGRQLVVSPSFRYYRQNAAKFYYYMVPDYNNWPEFYSADYRLSEFESFTYGISVTWRIQKWLSLDATYNRYVMQGLDGVTADSAYPEADIVGLGVRLWF